MSDVSSIDLSDQGFWKRPAAEREEAFATLRRESAVSWQRPPDSVLMGPEAETTGYWAVVRYGDVRAISRDPETFRSGQGVMFEDAPDGLREAR